MSATRTGRFSMSCDLKRPRLALGARRAARGQDGGAHRRPRGKWRADARRDVPRRCRHQDCRHATGADRLRSAFPAVVHGGESQDDGHRDGSLPDGHDPQARHDHRAGAPRRGVDRRRRRHRARHHHRLPVVGADDPRHRRLRGRRRRQADHPFGSKAHGRRLVAQASVGADDRSAGAGGGTACRSGRHGQP